MAADNEKRQQEHLDQIVKENLFQKLKVWTFVIT